MHRPQDGGQNDWWSWMTSSGKGQSSQPSETGGGTSRETYGELISTDARTTQAAASPSLGSEAAGRAPGAGGPEDEDASVYRAKIAATKMMDILSAKEKHRVSFDKGLYGAAIAMPQLARSAGYPKNMVVLAIRSYIFLLVNYAAQGLILYMIAKEENIWNSFAGQMYLCDFGRDSGNCPGGPNCVGPGGTEFSPPRLYSWDLWTTRVYVRDGLKAIFPDKADEIHSLVDPGEYGVESYWCRWLCCVLFCSTLLGDLMGSLNICRVFYDIPNKAEHWIDYDVPTWADKEHAKAIHGWSELELVRLKIAGMPLAWKLFNVAIILLPKMLLWKLTAEAGICFLMETSAIDDIVVNSVALAFILQIDELLCNELMSHSTRTMLEKLEDYHLEDFGKDNVMETMPDEEVYNEHENRLKATWSFWDFLNLLPLKMATVFFLTWLFVEMYYSKHCVRNEDGGLVSRDMRLPKGTDFTFLNAFFSGFFPVATEEEPFWTMPPDP